MILINYLYDWYIFIFLNFEINWFFVEKYIDIFIWKKNDIFIYIYSIYWYLGFIKLPILLYFIKFNYFIKYFDFDFYIKLIEIKKKILEIWDIFLNFILIFLFWKLGKLKFDCEEYLLIYWIINC